MTNVLSSPELLDPVNLRDLAAVPVASGYIRESVAFRSDDVSHLSTEYADSLWNRGIRTVIDLRSPGEAAHTGRGPLAAHAIAYHHIPLVAEVAAPAAMNQALPQVTTPDHVGQWYADLLESAAPQLATGLTVLALSPGGTVFHCAAGKDRTGVFAAALLSAVGADADAIADDYARTSAELPRLHARVQMIMGGFLPFDFDADSMPSGAMMGAERTSMTVMQRTLVRRHGDVLAPLRAAGLSQELVELLRTKMLATQ
ncbi:tyrosine-protein phosphatase [Rhodococcus globerulus]|uniref:tyrosine-protein phosphatase n=1 Tax=Rhodococcus globerulus TaxID=33008 RepID=UPI0039EA41E8